MYKKGSTSKTATESVFAATSPVVARIAASGNSGQVMVECYENNPVPARLLSHLDRRELASPENVGREVLVVFKQGNPELPIIIGVMENIVNDMVATELDPPAQTSEATVDGNKVTFDAKDEIILRCGKGSITLNREGRIVLNGTELVSRASGTNKIKGGSVEMN